MRNSLLCLALDASDRRRFETHLVESMDPDTREHAYAERLPLRIIHRPHGGNRPPHSPA